VSELPTRLQRSECLYNRAQVEAAFDQLADQLNAQLSGGDPLLVLVVMQGGLVTAGQLLPRLDLALELDSLRVSRYGSATEGSRLHWRHQPEMSLRGRRVLFVDDILDQGVTLKALVDDAWSQGAARVHTAVLARKRQPRKPAIEADFWGLEVPDRFVFGFGMDCRGLERNAPGIFAVAT